MGSEFGYKYEYTFSMMNSDEIQPNHKSLLQFDKYKTFLFDITTNFHLVRAETDELSVLIDSERFCFSLSEGLCRAENFPEQKSTFPLIAKIDFRLRECSARFRQANGAASPEHFYSDLIPVAVSFRVCTMQEVGEPYESAKDRAREIDPDVLKNDLIRLTRERNDERIMDADWVCFFCSKGQRVGDQISRLGCDHSFHSRCVFRWLEDHNACPECGYGF